MVSLLKMFGKGILYVIGFPFFIVALLIFGVIGLFLFIFQLFKSIIYFFTGQKFFPELPEDKELRMKREAAFAAANGAPVPNDVVFDQNPEDSYANQVPPTIQAIQFDEEPEAPQVPPYNPVPPVQEEPEMPVYEEEADSFQSVEQACFKQPQQEEQPKQEEQPEEDALSSLTRDEPETTIETADPSVQEVEEEEELEEYVPKGTNYIEDIEEEDTHNGVDIDYDVR